MAPVQTFISSPITAAKAPTATAQPPADNKTAPATTTAAPSSSSSTSRYGPPPAQPGSRPSFPAAAITTSSGSSPPQAAVTGAAHTQATPTQQLPSSNNPPAPQPGAVPAPPGATAASQTLPPPPKKGETLGPEHTSAAASATAGAGYPPPTTMPAQMSYAPPTASHAIRGTSTTQQFASPYESGPVQLPVGTGLGGGINQATDMSHPPGYQQNAHAAEFSSGQRAAHNAYLAQNSDFGSSLGVGGGDGDANIWNTAKKWASAAGDKLAAAEGEVWKAVNKDQK